MQEYITQFIVKTKSEAMDSGLKFTVQLSADAPGVTGDTRIVVSDPEVKELFETNKVFDVTFTPHIDEPE